VQYFDLGRKRAGFEQPGTAQGGYWWVLLAQSLRSLVVALEGALVVQLKVFSWAAMGALVVRSWVVMVI